MFGNNKDFAENGSIENGRLLQSEHWTTLQYTLFVSMYDWLQMAEWNAMTGHLNVGAEVTVDGELIVKKDTPISQDSHWATVVGPSPGQEPVYIVRDEQGTITTVPRARLRHRSVVTVACLGMSDDLKHDRFSNDHWGRVEITWVEDHIKENHPEDLVLWGGRITSLHAHSDNAAQHFKRREHVTHPPYQLPTLSM